MEIATFDAADAAAARATLAGILCDAVNGGASVGFLPPLTVAEAETYWDSVIATLATGGRALLAARAEGQIFGTVQLDLPAKPNARHRAEVQKLLVHSAARRRGVGMALMVEAEALARRLGRTLLVLDTREGDGAEHLYRRIGYREAGRIPGYARNGDGGLDATILFYRQLEADGG